MITLWYIKDAITKNVKVHAGIYGGGLLYIPGYLKQGSNWNILKDLKCL